MRILIPFHRSRAIYCQVCVYSRGFVVVIVIISIEALRRDAKFGALACVQFTARKSSCINNRWERARAARDRLLLLNLCAALYYYCKFVLAL